MPNRFKQFAYAVAAFFVAFSVVKAQTNPPAPAPATSPTDTLQKAPIAPIAPVAETNTKPVSPKLPTAPSATTKGDNSLLLVQASGPNAAPAASVPPNSA